MPVPLDVITHKNLILVKQIYQRAVVLSASQHSDVDRILSLISFDLANETILKNAITAVNSRATLPTEVKQIIQTADTVFAAATPPIPSVPDAQKVHRVRRIRNSAMHEAKYPTASDISDCRTYTRDFLQQLVMNVWGEDFNAIKLTDLIKHPLVKKHLLEAETKMDEDDYWNAAVHSVAGFGAALSRVRAAILGMTFGNNWMEIAPMKEILILPIIGLDYPSYALYKRYTRNIHVNRFADGGISCNHPGVEPTAEETAFVVNYAINSTIQIESLAGNLDKPFDMDSMFLGKFI